MPATEIFQQILTAVASEAEVPESKILSSCKERDAVDARYILVYLLHKRMGLYPARIKALTGICERSINYIITYYERRYSQSNFLRTIADNVAYKLRTTSESTDR